MKIRITQDISLATDPRTIASFVAGDVVQVDEAVALRLIELGAGTAEKPAPEENKAENPVKENKARAKSAK